MSPNPMNIPFKTTTRKLALAVLAVASLAGCAGMNTANTPEARVTERAQKRWQALIAGQFDKAYEYSTPSYRSNRTLAQFRGRFGSAVSWISAEVVDIECEPAKCAVKVKVTSKPLLPGTFGGTIDVHADETWLMEDGQWWFFPKP